MPAGAMGGRASEFSCGPTSFCLSKVLSTEAAMLCMYCGQDANEPAPIQWQREYSCDLTTSQCVCEKRNLVATTCATSVDCGLPSSICNVQASFYALSYSTQLCSESIGRSFCTKSFMHNGMGTCTSYVNAVANMLPTCTDTAAGSAQKYIFDEELCLGYTPNLAGRLNVGVLMADTFVFPCVDIFSFSATAQNPPSLACVNIVLDTSIQNSFSSYLTFNIGNSARQRRRLLLSEYASPDDDRNDDDRGHHTSMLEGFVQQSSGRIAAITGACRQTLLSCVTPLQPQSNPKPPGGQESLWGGASGDCDSCARVWWFVNYTLSVPGHSEHAAVKDTDLLDLRSILLQLAHNPSVMRRMLQRAPRAFAVLVRDWLRDDSVFDMLMRHLVHPVRHLDDLMHSVFEGMHAPVPAKTRSGKGQKATTTSVLPDTTIATSSHPHRTPARGGSAVAPPPGEPGVLQMTAKKAPGVDTAHGRGTVYGSGGRRTLLQSGVSSSESADSISSSLSSSRDSAISQLQGQMPFFDVSLFSDIFSDVAARNQRLDDELRTIRVTTFSDAFDSSDATSCMLSFGTVQNDIIMNFAKVLQKDGWSVKPVCTQKQLLAFSTSVPVCPILTAPFTRAYANTLTIAQYYAYMVQSGCLTNMSVSCLRTPEYAKQGIVNALPRLSTDVKYTNNTLQDLKLEKDPISYVILRFFYTATDFISFDRSVLMSSVMAFTSTDALYDDLELDKMVRNNEYSIGRLLHDYFSCNLQQTISCSNKNLSLLPVGVSLFIVLLLLHLALPIPSVVSFFLWVWGLSYGILYMSYNFSPLCSPRIPTCLGSGLYELSEQVLPLQISIPPTLYHADRCYSNLTLKPQYAKLTPGFACGKTCLDSPYEMTDMITVLIAAETWLRYDTAVFMRQTLVRGEFLLPHSLARRYHAIIEKYSADVHANQEGYVLGFVVCIFFNSYKLIGLFIVLTVFVPFVLNLVFSLVTFVCVLILKYTFFAYGTDIYGGIH